MAIVATEGFDLYADYAALLAESAIMPLSGAGAVLGFSTTLGRRGGGAMLITDGAQPMGDSFIYPLTIAPGSPIRAHFAFFVSAYPDVDTNLMSFLTTNSAAAFLARVVVTADGSIKALNQQGATLNTSASAVVRVGQWNFLAVDCSFGSNDTNGSINVRLNSVSLFTSASIDTFNAASTAWIQMGGGLGVGKTMRIDDMILIDNQGSTISTILDDTVIATLTPNAAGTTQNWTANGAATQIDCVDDVPNAANGDTDYISSSTVNQESNFNMSSLPFTGVTIRGVSVRAKARKDDAGSRVLNSTIKVGASSTTPVKTASLGDNYRWEQLGGTGASPATLGNFTEAEINAIEIGVKVNT